MTELSKEAVGLLEEARRDQPDAATRDRMLASITATVTPAAPADPMAAVVTKGAGVGAAKAIAIGVTVVGLAAAGVVVSTQMAAEPAVEQAQSVRPVAPPMEAPEPVPEPAPVELAKPRPAPAPKAAPVEPPARADGAVSTAADRLALEVAILKEARASLVARDLTATLGALNEHLERFPEGKLAPEREATRAVAWCELGDVNQGRILAAEFLSQHSTSPLAPRVRQACRQ